MEGVSYRLVIKPLAELDISETYAWYNVEQEGLGDAYLDQLERSLKFIEKNPKQYQIRFKGVRMILRNPKYLFRQF